MAVAPDLFAGVLPFVTIAAARSFRTAAEQLGVTPSAVSKAVARLESELGVQLLRRTSRSVTLTAEGAAFFTRCRDAVDQVGAAREAASSAQRAPRGVLRISLSLPLARLVIMPALPRLLARHPALTVQALVTDRAVDLAKENVDVAVRVGPARPSSLVARRLSGTRWATVAAPAYLARRAAPLKSPRDLLAHNCLKFLTPSGTAVEWAFRAPGGDAAETVRTEGNLLAGHGEALVQAAVAGLGVVQALDFMVADEITRGELVEVLANHATEGPPVFALYPSSGRAAAPKVRAFVDFAAEVIGAGLPPRP